MTALWTLPRLWSAGALILAYAALCVWCAWRHRRQAMAKAQAREALQVASEGVPPWVVAYASQTGEAEQLAWQSAQTLHLAGMPVRVCSLDEFDRVSLAQARHVLFVVSTYGEGDPPDNATEFSRLLSAPPLSLASMQYAVLALGDRSYEQFCGFGRGLDQWLQASGAHPWMGRLEVDRMDPQTIGQWFQQLGHQVGASDVSPWQAPDFSDWRLVARRHLNPHSVGEPVFHLELEPVSGVLPDWQAGDLVQIAPPETGLPSHARDYSIASIPEEGRLQLLVRLRHHESGEPGLVSGWLGMQACLGDGVSLRVREHKGFRVADNSSRPLILIGNGTGIAGLRAHLKARVSQAGVGVQTAPCWLVFGERQSDVDFHYREEFVSWQQQGVLTRLDAVFSRDHPQQPYVQHRLAQEAVLLREWVDQGAALYVCGSLAGMATGVDEVLREALGSDAVDTLARQGRYCRDIY